MKSTQMPVALITGAARRIGAAIAQHLHSAGYQVIIHYRHSATTANALCQQLNDKRPNSAHCLCADFNDQQQITQLAKQAYGIYQRIDVLVNNASSYFKTKLGETNEQQWHDLINSNLKAPFFLSQALKPYLCENHGNIINIVDIYAQHPRTDYSVYCIAKAGLAMLTKSLAKEWGPRIRVNGVAPAINIWAEGDNQPDEQKKQNLIASTVLKRRGDPEDIAQTVLFLLQNSYITGQIIAVDGGRAINSL